MVLASFKSARARSEKHPHPSNHPTAPVGTSSGPRGNLRHERYEETILRCPPYALSEYDWSDQFRDIKGVTVTYRNSDGEMVRSPDS